LIAFLWPNLSSPITLTPSPLCASMVEIVQKILLVVMLIGCVWIPVEFSFQIFCLPTRFYVQLFKKIWTRKRNRENSRETGTERKK
jgi:hypothetical protein